MQEICKLCADQALATNLLDESAYLYLLAGHIEKALECFTKAANANGCRHLRAVGAISEDALRSALKKIEDQFLLHNNFAALVEMHKDLQVYLVIFEKLHFYSAARCFIETFHFVRYFFAIF